MPAPGQPPPPKRTTPQIKPAVGINPSTGEDIVLPSWAAQASYYLRSRVTITLIVTALGMFGAKIGFEPDKAESEQLINSLDGIILGVGWMLALVFNIKRRWVPPTIK